MEFSKMNKDNKNLIAYCGLYCGECPVYEGKIADLARELRKEFRKAKSKEIAQSILNFFKEEDKTGFAETEKGKKALKVFEDYPICYEVLGAFAKMRCKKICKDGGGPLSCKVRKCCVKKDIEGCWQCDEFETCEKFGLLKIAHGDGHIKNLRKLKKKGVDEFIQGKKYWYSEIKKS